MSLLDTESIALSNYEKETFSYSFPNKGKEPIKATFHVYYDKHEGNFSEEEKFVVKHQTTCLVESNDLTVPELKEFFYSKKYDKFLEQDAELPLEFIFIGRGKDA